MTLQKHASIDALTQYLEVNGVTYAYRRFGNDTGIPIIGFQHFTGTLDNWDPTILDGLAAEREVIIFDNKGVGNSSGVTPDNVWQMTEDAIEFIRALGIEKFDVLGFSLGGFIAQYLGVRYAELIRKVIIVGSAPQGAKVLEGFNELIANGPHSDPIELFLYIFFTRSERSRELGRSALSRLFVRTMDRDKDATSDTVNAQAKAITDWGKTADIDLKKFSAPLMIIQGSNDEMMDSDNSYAIFKQIPNSLLSYYPDSAHGSFFQYPDMFVKQANDFLDNFQP
ncbi:alpha/beta hydrolase [Sphingobacterium sp.]|uniref:alpha/beta fold hydrolase n=1 Tax=Sphingobacterium sp. TaxID=341027 RepID=UPI002899CDBE|nr:alpha/beta hydrolase [Sphingobacterium sp.]